MNDLRVTCGWASTFSNSSNWKLVNVVRYRRCLRFGAKPSSMSPHSLFWSEIGLLVPPLVGGAGRSIMLAIIFDAASCGIASIFVSSDIPMTGVSNCGIRAIVRILMLIYSPATKKNGMLFNFWIQKMKITNNFVPFENILFEPISVYNTEKKWLKTIMDETKMK